MKVVRVNDFDIPSDENDYDELVAFADTMASIEQFEAIPKDQYEARLKADMVAMLEDLDLLIDEFDPGCGWDGYIKKIDVQELIQDKVNELKAESEG